MYKRQTLDHQTLDITVTVDNRDSQTMYFSVGGHPGFNLPLEEGLALSLIHI